MNDPIINQAITVGVIYALPQEQTVVKVQVAQGSTLADAIQNSGILEKYPEIDLRDNKLGIFGKLSKQDVLLRDLDRVEIYRPLLADPKEVRKKRTEEGKVMKKGGGDA